MSVMLKAGSFEGPLHLLLELINEQKLPITEVALAQVTGQYFAYLKNLGDERGEALADFLVVATKLVYLKSRELLPKLEPEAGDGLSLADQLRLYQRFVAASKQVLELWGRGMVLAYNRSEPPIKLKEFVLPANATAEHVRDSLVILLQRLKPVAPIPEVAIDRSVSIRERIQKIFDYLKQWKRLSWCELLRGAKSKTEVIIGFLALLELVKQDKVAVEQQASFEDLIITHV